MAKFDLQLLGGFSLKGAKAKSIAVPGKKAQALLTYLALKPGAQSREKLATLLWGDRMDEQARHSLRQALSSLRKALGDGKNDPLAADAETVELEPGALAVDALAFAEAVAEGSSKALIQAAALYSGPLVDGMHSGSDGFDDWLAGERERLHALACDVLEKLAAQQAEAGEPENAIATANRLLSLDAAREEGHRQLMRLYAATGRRADALRQYQACADALRRELDAEPSAETTRLHEEIREVNEPVGAPPAQHPEVSNDPLLLGGPPPLPDRASIAVLPFENMSGDPEQEYFSDGLAEDIITDLSKVSGLFVIARHSSFTYKGKAVTVSQIGKELGVRHILEGSVRKAGDRVRITVQLVKTETSHQIWAERYDRTLEDLFAVQDEITQEVVTALDVKLVEGEQARIWRKSLKNPRAREFFYRARESFNHLTKESQVLAREFFIQVIGVEPDSPQGYVRQAWSHWYDAFRGWSDSPGQSLLLAEELAQKALSRDENNPEAHITQGLIHIVKKEFEQAIAEGERAVLFGPNMADVVAFQGMIFYFVGRYEDAYASMRRAMRLCPVCPAYYLVIMGQSLNLLERYEEAIRSFQTAATIEPDYPTPYFGLAVAHSALKRKNEARIAADAFRKVAPNLSSLQEYARRHPFKEQAVIERWINVLKRAGIE